MRRRVWAGAVVAGLLTVTVPASATTPSGTTGATATATVTTALISGAPLSAGSAAASAGWVPAPTPDADFAAGVRCDFPVHATATLDKGKSMVLTRYPDGSTRREATDGAAILRVTNTTTGAFLDADASGSVLVDHATDGSVTYQVFGPQVLGIAEGGGNLPRGLYLVDGAFRVVVSPAQHRTLTMTFGTRDNICDQLA